MRGDATKLNFTPVNSETFAIWCEEYKEKVRIEKAKSATGNENKPTGKEMFLENQTDFDNITLDEMDEDDEEFKAAAEDEAGEETKNADDSDEEEFVYDRALYDADGLDDEDVDFDDDDWKLNNATIL